MEFAEDSPMFKKQVALMQESADLLRVRVDSLIRSSREYCSSANAFSKSNLEFARQLSEFTNGAGFETSFLRDSIVGPAFAQFRSVLFTLSALMDNMTAQIGRSFITPLESFVEQSIKDTRECKRSYEMMSKQYDSARTRYLSKKKDKADVARIAFQNKRQRYEQARFNYVRSLNKVETHKKFELLESIANCMCSQLEFFNQGSEVMRELEPKINELMEFADEFREESNDLEDRLTTQLIGRQSAQRQILTDEQRRKLQTRALSPGGRIVTRTGYLLKKCRTGMNPWRRRYFVLSADGVLTYRLDSRDDEARGAIKLLFSTVKDNSTEKMSHCFEVISTDRSYMLQAESDYEKEEWIASLQTAISVLLNQVEPEATPSRTSRRTSAEGSSTPVEQQVIPAWKVKAMLDIDKNNTCVDCGCEGTDWASINMGSFMCVECSGIHRSLGVDVSKVRSIHLDTWEAATYEVVEALGNRVAESIWESSLNGGNEELLKLQKSAPRAEKERFIKQKYVERAFVRVEEKLNGLSGPEYDQKLGRLLTGAVSRANFEESLRLLAQPFHGHIDTTAKRINFLHSISFKDMSDYEKTDGGDDAPASQENPDSSDYIDENVVSLLKDSLEEGVQDVAISVMHIAVLLGSRSFLEFLLLHGGSVNVEDSHRRRPVDLASRIGRPAVVHFLISRGATSGEGL